MNLLILSHWNWFSSWPSTNIDFRYKCKIWLTCYVSTYGRVNNIFLLPVSMCFTLKFVCVIFIASIVIILLCKGQICFYVSHKTHPFKSKNSLLLQNIHSLIFILHTRDLPSQCLGLNYVYVLHGAGNYKKKLDVITFPISSSNRDTQRSNGRITPSKQNPLVCTKPKTPI